MRTALKASVTECIEGVTSRVSEVAAAAKPWHHLAAVRHCIAAAADPHRSPSAAARLASTRAEVATLLC
eukprot:9314500-Alexandrium_andersonii.AAC.1